MTPDYSNGDSHLTGREKASMLQMFIVVIICFGVSVASASEQLFTDRVYL
jgi:hypothetical protein